MNLANARRRADPVEREKARTYLKERKDKYNANRRAKYRVKNSRAVMGPRS